ncbi:MAG: hypothetical protein IJ629_00010 [Clostridia bacterium]|nr:hypothetical protein [Clostridia bacterium]
MEIQDGYTFEKFFEDLKNGFQIYYTYMGCRYLIYKLTKNCYKNELIEAPPKCPHQKNAILTLKRVREIFDDMTELQYKFEM